MTITVVFDPPLPSDSPATFNTKAFTLLGDLNDWSTEANALAVSVNADEAVLDAAVASATASASTATTQAGTATTQAGIATTQAGNAATSASTATTQAGIATTKAGEANASAIAAAAAASTVNLTSPGPIGGTTPAAGSFTALSATTSNPSSYHTTTLRNAASTGYNQLEIYASNGGVESAMRVQHAPGIFSRLSTDTGSISISPGLVDVATFTSTGLNNTVIGATTPVAGSFTTLSATGALTTAGLREDASGNLGLGTVPSAWSGISGSAFEIKGNAYIASTTHVLRSGANAYFNGSNWLYKSTNYATAYEQVSGTHVWSTAPSGTAGNAITFAARMSLSEAGNLTVAGSITAAGQAVGYLGIPQVSQSAAYTLVLTDAGKHILHPSADTTARIFTIPANSSVAFPVGTAVTFVNQNAGGVITIAITTDTMRLAGAGTTGSRTLAANGVATAIKLTATEWIISGTGLT